jgi:hypothetical protein
LLNDLKFDKRNFIDEVGGILEQGCPSSPCDTVEKLQRLNWASKRKSNFRLAVEALDLPIKSAAFREIESVLMKGKEAFEETVLSLVNPTTNSHINHIVINTPILWRLSDWQVLPRRIDLILSASVFETFS